VDATGCVFVIKKTDGMGHRLLPKLAPSPFCTLQFLLPNHRPTNQDWWITKMPSFNFLELDGISQKQTIALNVIGVRMNRWIFNGR
jgi:hypothetical protein